MNPSPIHGGYSASFHSPATGAQQARFTNLHSGSAQDRYESGHSQKKPGLIKRTLNASIKLGGLILGGLAIHRYFPGLASKVGAAIPGFIKNPFNQLAGTGIAQKVTTYGNILLNYSEGWFGQAKQWISGFLAKQAA
jgi:hypothetical protein